MGTGILTGQSLHYKSNLCPDLIDRTIVIYYKIRFRGLLPQWELSLPAEGNLFFTHISAYGHSLIYGLTIRGNNDQRVEVRLQSSFKEKWNHRDPDRLPGRFQSLFNLPDNPGMYDTV